MDELPTERALVEWVERMRGWIRSENQDLVLPISGDTGDGKSTLALILASMFDREFSAETLSGRISWDAQRHMELAKRVDRFQVLVLDEGEGLFARDAMKGGNREFSKFLYECRKLNLVHILLFPNWSAVDSTVQGFRANWRIQVREKGVADLMRRKGDSGNWGQVFRFEWPSLEGLELWREYERLAYRAARGLPLESEPGGESDEDEVFVAELAGLVGERLAPLVDQIRREAGLEVEDGGG